MKNATPVEWTVDRHRHHTTRSGPWRFTVFPYSTGWAWVQESRHNLLALALSSGVAPSLLSAQQCVLDIIEATGGA